MLVVLQAGVKGDVQCFRGSHFWQRYLQFKDNKETFTQQTHPVMIPMNFPVLPQGSPAAQPWHTYTALGTPAQHSGFGFRGCGTGQLQVFYEGKHRAKPSRLPALLSSMPAAPAPHSSQLETSVHRPQG